MLRSTHRCGILVRELVPVEGSLLFLGDLRSHSCRHDVCSLRFQGHWTVHSVSLLPGLRSFRTVFAFSAPFYRSFPWRVRRARLLFVRPLASRLRVLFRAVLVSHVSFSRRIRPVSHRTVHADSLPIVFLPCIAPRPTPCGKARRAACGHVSPSFDGGSRSVPPPFSSPTPSQARTTRPSTRLHRRTRVRTPRGRRHGAVCAHVHRRSDANASPFRRTSPAPPFRASEIHPLDVFEGKARRGI